MAKKKKKTAKRAANRPSKKVAKSKVSKRPAVKRSSGSTSVDALLKRFGKERSAKEAQLDALRKKKTEMEEKAAKLREQIAKLAEQEKQFQNDLTQLDARRDQEVSQLLAKLGVQWSDTPRQGGGGENHGDGRSGNEKGPRERVTQAFSKRRDEQN